MNWLTRGVVVVGLGVLSASCAGDDTNPSGEQGDASVTDVAMGPRVVADGNDARLAETGAPESATADGRTTDTLLDATADVITEPPSCRLTSCGASCVDTQTDPQHCGSCASACAGTEVCFTGACWATCPPGFVACGRSCVDPTSSPTHCGATLGCSADAGSAGAECPAGQVCSSGSCRLSCQTGLVNCSGTCVNPTINPRYCGATDRCGVGGGTAGASCAPGQVCNNGTCQLSCQTGLAICSGVCVNPQSDNHYCGASAGCGVEAGSPGTDCPAGQVCSNGACHVSCQSGLVNCGGSCINGSLDRTHCGATGNCQGGLAGVACASGQVCTAGSCQLSCQSGLVNCAGACVDPANDRAHCGASVDCAGNNAGAACSAGQVCTGGTCQLSCQLGLVNCAGKCVDPSGDNAHCGASGDCGGANAGASCPAGQVCSAATCGLTCQAGLLNCNGICVDPTADNTHCGATADCLGANAGAVCAPGRVCNGSICSLTCQAGLVNCDGTCVDPGTERAHCGAVGDCRGASSGAACAAGQVCSGGSCQVSCQAGLVDCAGTCINPSSDVGNCGATGDCTGADAGAVCAAGHVCNGGVCSLSCQAGLINCGATCIGPLTDDNHCGASGDCQGSNGGVVCAEGEVCRAGACTLACQSGLVNCSGTCVNPLADLGHCGASADCTGANIGTVCNAGQICSSGTCQLSCQTGLVDCGGVCINPTTDNAHCGASGDCLGARVGAPCAAGQVCNGGSCGLTCQAALVNCSGLCVNPSSDGTHCGATNSCQGADVGAVCAAGQVCSGGVCDLTCQSGLINCGGTCVNAQTDRVNCGAVADCQGGVPCGTGQVCNSGTCQLSCQTGLVNCGGTCLNPSTDPGHCGASAGCDGPGAGAVCGAGEVCAGGLCQVSCQAGLVNCGSVCLDPLTDRGHCGASDDCAGLNVGSVCSSGQVCTGGVCQLSCQTGLVNCGGTCVDPLTDRTHCGASGACGGTSAGIACASGQVCSAGTCEVSCPSGQVNCASTCIVASSDRTHCGATGDCLNLNSGAACGSGEVCNGGTCQVSCPAAQVNCGGTCVAPSTDRNHCGATGDCAGINGGTACAAGQVCSTSTCQASCQAGQANCSGSCTTLSSDPLNCNLCGRVCPGRANAALACGNGNCGFVCNTNFGDCDASRANGCETSLLADANNCGACGNVCPSGIACDASLCVLTQALGSRPVNGDIEVDLQAPAQVTFGIDLDPATVTNTTVTASGGMSIGGVVSYADGVVSLAPSTGWPQGTTVTVTLGTGIHRFDGVAVLLAPYTFTFSTLSYASLIAQWRFDNNGADATGNGHTVTLLGAGATYTSSPHQGTAALHLDGTGSGDAGTINLGNLFTIAGWFNLVSLGTDIHTIVSTGNGGIPQMGFKVFINSFQTGDGRISVESGNGSAGCLMQTPSGFVTAGSWLHFAVTVNRPAGTATIYWNGVAAVPLSNPVPCIKTDFANNRVMRIGRFVDELFPMRNGSIDDLRIYNRILTAAEVAQIASQ